MTTGSTDLDAILTGTPVEAEPETVEATPEPTVETPAAPTAAETPKEDKPPGQVPFQALQDERRKRQQYELGELRKTVEALKKPAEAKPNLFEDPEKWEQTKDDQFNQRISEVESRTEARFLQLCENAAKARYADFDDAVTVFAEAVQNTPGLADEARRAPDPAEFIYRAGLNLKRVKEAGSIDALIERAREEGRQEALKGRVTPQIPESLTDIAGAKGDRAQQWAGPKPLTQLIPTI